MVKGKSKRITATEIRMREREIEGKAEKPDVSSAMSLLEGALFAIMGHSKRKDKDEQVNQITNALVILNKHGKKK